MSEGQEYLEKRFNVTFQGRVGFQSGINYDTATFELREDAELIEPKVTGVVKSGMLAGLPCGIIREEWQKGGKVYTMVMT